MNDQVQSAKRLARAYWAAVDRADPKDVSAVCRAHLSPEFYADGPAPFKKFDTPQALADRFLSPFKAALPQFVRHFHIFMSGFSNGRQDGLNDGSLWVAACGYFIGHAVKDF